MEAELLYFDGCPHWRAAADTLHQVADELGVTVEHRRVTGTDEDRVAGFAGSPTILIDGRDPFPGSEPTGALSCRLFATADGPAGSPTAEQLRVVMRSPGRG